MSPENRANHQMMSNQKLSKNNYSMGMLKANKFANTNRLMSTQINRPKTNNNQRIATMQLLDQQRHKSANIHQVRYGNVNNSLNFSANKGGMSMVQGQSRQDLNRLFSAASHAQAQGHTIGSFGLRINPYTEEAEYSSQRAATSKYTFKREKHINQTKSGITAIDLYYQGLD